MNFLDHLRAQWFAALFGCILYIAAITILFWNEVYACEHISGHTFLIANKIST